ncbi:Lipase [bioreactor metagenome]|uniref:Lipase n=1 Tax=bioreactor metagenome TaxID=1076179 RepID=A0A645DCZ6_9ZZZZ
MFIFAYEEMMSVVNTNGFFDAHLEQFGVDENTPLKSYKDVLKFIDQAGNDTAEYDLSPEGANKINSFVTIQHDVYYFSVPFNTTDPLPLTNFYLPKVTTNPFNLIPALLMCFGTSGNHDGIQMDGSWRENDSLVSTVSATYPFDEPHVDYDKNNIQKGVWNVMPVQTGDHFTPMGLFADKDQTREFFKNLAETISSLKD